MRSFDVIIVSVAVAIIALVIGLVSGAQIASNSVEVYRDGECVYVYVLGEPQVYYIGWYVKTEQVFLFRFVQYANGQNLKFLVIYTCKQINLLHRKDVYHVQEWRNGRY